MIAWRSLSRSYKVLKVPSSNVTPNLGTQFQVHYYGLSTNWKMGCKKGSWSVMELNKKRKQVNLVWRSVSTKASSCEESALEDVVSESRDSSQVQEVSDSAVCETSTIKKDVENEPMSSEKHSISVEVGSSLMRFIKGKGGSTQKRIEDEMGVKILFPSSKKEDNITIEGNSTDDISRASEKIEAIIEGACYCNYGLILTYITNSSDYITLKIWLRIYFLPILQAVQSPSLDYSHFISLPLAIHPELVEKLFIFQNSILGDKGSSEDQKPESESSEDTSDKEEGIQPQQHVANVEVKLRAEDGQDSVKVNLTSIPLVSYAPKAAKSPSTEAVEKKKDLGIDKSIFIKPRTFHLTVLMLKLWNKERVAVATEVLQSISSKVMEALDNRPIFIRLKGLDCMKGSLAKARVLYSPVEVIGGEDRFLRACQVITDAYMEAGLVLEKDAKQKLKLHATIMNARHRKSKKGEKSRDSFDARGIFKQYGSEEWGEYIISEAHLSKRFMFDENGYYYCCASIPFPETMASD